MESADADRVSADFRPHPSWPAAVSEKRRPDGRGGWGRKERPAWSPQSWKYVCCTVSRLAVAKEEVFPDINFLLDIRERNAACRNPEDYLHQVVARDRRPSGQAHRRPAPLRYRQVVHSSDPTALTANFHDYHQFIHSYAFYASIDTCFATTRICYEYFCRQPTD